MTNVKEIRGVENHHKNTAVIIDVGKIHWWVLKLVGKSLSRNRIFAYP